MNIRVPLAMVILVGLASGVSAQNPKATPFSLLLHATHSTVKVGSPVDVDLTTTNNLNRPIKLGKSNPGMEYQIQVRDQQGQLVPSTVLYKQLQNPVYVFRLTTQILQPQQSATEIFDIAMFFDLNKAGTYSIQLQRLLPQELGKGSVSSNTLVLTITP